MCAVVCLHACVCVFMHAGTLYISMCVCVCVQVCVYMHLYEQANVS